VKRPTKRSSELRKLVQEQRRDLIDSGYFRKPNHRDPDPVDGSEIIDLSVEFKRVGGVWVKK